MLRTAALSAMLRTAMLGSVMLGSVMHAMLRAAMLSGMLSAAQVSAAAKPMVPVGSGRRIHPVGEVEPCLHNRDILGPAGQRVNATDGLHVCADLVG